MWDIPNFSLIFWEYPPNVWELTGIQEMVFLSGITHQKNVMKTHQNSMGCTNIQIICYLFVCLFVSYASIYSYFCWLYCMSNLLHLLFSIILTPNSFLYFLSCSRINGYQGDLVCFCDLTMQIVFHIFAMSFIRDATS